MYTPEAAPAGTASCATPVLVPAPTAGMTTVALATITPDGLTSCTLKGDETPRLDHVRESDVPASIDCEVAETWRLGDEHGVE